MTRSGGRVVRLRLAVVAGLVVALASAPRPLAAQGQVQRIVISLPGHAAPILLDTIGLVREVPGPPAQAFAALDIVYRSLQIPRGIADSARRYIGNLHFTKMHRLGAMSLSAIIDCGLDMTGPRADAYRVHFAIVSRVDSVSPSVSRLHSTVVAGAEDVMGASKEPIRCGSTGLLESRITELVTNHLKGR